MLLLLYIIFAFLITYSHFIKYILERFEFVSLSPPSVYEAEGVEGVGKSHTKWPLQNCSLRPRTPQAHFILGLLLLCVECSLGLKFKIFKILEF